MNKEIIFVDSSVQDYPSLSQGINGDRILILKLKENLSAIEQITQALADRKYLAAVHILSHGSEGSLKLGADVLNENNLENFSTQIKQWGNALTANGNILLYGCDVGAGEAGLNFVKHLSEITGADVAASNNLTGSAAQGGDGELEVKFGEIETQTLNFANYDYTLAEPTGTADTKGINVSATPTSTAIDVLANDTGTGRLSVNSIVTGPSHGTAIIGDSIYVSGRLETFDGPTRNYIEKLNPITGAADTTFNPNANGEVRAIAIDSNGNLIVSGSFTSIGGQSRNNIAKLNPTTGAADTTFNPNARGYVNQMAIDSSGNIFFSGSYPEQVIGGYRNPPTFVIDYMRKLNPTGDGDPRFSPKVNGFSVIEIAIDSSGNPIVALYDGSLVAKLNPTTGAADTTFNLNLNPTPNPYPRDYLHEIAFDSSGNLIVGGTFSTIGGTSRNKIAKLDPTTGAVDPTFNPNPNSAVDAIALDSSGNLIVGGSFTSIGGPTRRGIAKLNPTTGAADTTFNSTIDFAVTEIAFDSSGNLIVGGTHAGGMFATVGGPTRRGIAKLNPTTGAVDPTFNRNASGNISNLSRTHVYAIAIDPKKNILYTPNANFNGVDTFTYTAKDSSGVSTPITVNLLVNDSPLLDNSGTPTLTAINQGDTNNLGTLISSIIANLGGTKITDSNTDAKQGIAITNLDTTNGSWQYTTDGTTWNNTPAVSATNALLLASDTNTKIRFVPNASYDGTVTNAITFAAWDRITGTNGSTANYTADQTNNTTSSFFSSATETANITVIDTTAPTVTINQAAAQVDPTATSPINFTVTFSEPVTGFDASDIDLTASTTTGTLTPTITGNGPVYNVAVNGMTGSGNVIASIKANGVTDTAGNKNTASTSTDNTVIYNNKFPTVTSINRFDTSPTAAATATYGIKFSEDVTGVDTGDFTLVPNGVTGASIDALTVIDAKTYQLQVNTGTGTGTIGLNLTDDDRIKNSLGVALGGANPGNGNLTGQVYEIDKTPPSGSLNAVADITTAVGTSQSLTVTFSDNNAVDVSSLDSSDLLINWSGGDIPAQFVSVDTNSNGTPRTATYSLTPPGGSWDDTDNGTYTVKLQGSQVKDSLGNLAVAGSLGTFNVNIAVPTPTVTPTPTPITNNIPDDSCICDQIAYPNLNQPNSVENTILGGSGLQIGTAKNDEFLGSNSGNRFDAQSGDDNLYGGSGDYILHGNQGNDFITGGNGDDLLYGDEGNDIILGEFGKDLIWGGKGYDSLNGREGDDIILGNKDDDFIDGGQDNDTLFGGQGNDILLGSQGEDYLFGNKGWDTICGGAGNDLINGNEQADILGGCEGNDTLYGGEDNDTLTGGQGDDRLYGDLGNDSLIGGSGNDIFVLNAGQGFDIISDFTVGQDLIGLSGGLSFGQLELIPNDRGILINNLLTGEQLGVMIGVSPNLITSANFRLI